MVRAVHGLAVLLFRRRHRIHDDVWAAKDATYTVNAVTRSNPDVERSPTPFCHPEYVMADQYPDGDADVVGYWAENRIFGGVVLLDRSDSWDDRRNPEPNVFLHSSYYDVTFRVWRALDEQQQDLVDFLLSRSPAEACPFPLLASEKNLDRIDPQYATSQKVYRDFWERRLPLAMAGSRNRTALGVGWTIRRRTRPRSYHTRSGCDTMGRRRWQSNRSGWLYSGLCFVCRAVCPRLVSCFRCPSHVSSHLMCRATA